MRKLLKKRTQAAAIGTVSTSDDCSARSPAHRPRAHHLKGHVEMGSPLPVYTVPPTPAAAHAVLCAPHAARKHLGPQYHALRHRAHRSSAGPPQTADRTHTAHRQRLAADIAQGLSRVTGNVAPLCPPRRRVRSSPRPRRRRRAFRGAPQRGAGAPARGWRACCGISLRLPAQGEGDGRGGGRGGGEGGGARGD